MSHRAWESLLHLQVERVALLGVMLVVSISGCGKSSQNVNTNPDGGAAALKDGGGTGDKACKSKSQCPEINMSYDATGRSATGILVGYVNAPVQWVVTGNDLDLSGRTVAILLDNFPSGSTLSSTGATELTNSVAISWVPDKTQKSSTDMVVVMRDLDRCLVNESDQTKCNANKFLDTYDKKETIAWEVDDAAAATTDAGTTGDDSLVRVSNPNCGPTPTSNSDITGKLLQTGIGVLTGGVGALIPAVIGGLSGGGSTANVDPTQC